MTIPFIACCVTAVTSADSPRDGAEEPPPIARPDAVGTEDAFRSPEDGGPRRWQVAGDDGLRLRDAPASDAPAIGAVDAGEILSGFGCVRVDGATWCEVRHFRGGPRGFAAGESLAPARGPDGIVPYGTDDSAARVRAKDFDARVRVPCAQEHDRVYEACDAAVARGSGGDATVVATFPNGFSRTLFFVHGEFVSASATMSGSGTDTDWSSTNGLHTLRVDGQSYELTDEFVFGGRGLPQDAR